MTNKILVVEDEEAIRGFIKVNLKRNNFDVIEAGSGEEALEKLDDSVDIVLLDVMLPGINGFEVCAKAREAFPQLGVIILTAKGQEENKIEGLEAGADDYIVKPFSPKELLARINALLRRLSIQVDEAGEDAKEITTGIFTMNIDERRFLKNGKEIELTPIEFSLVKYFMENATSGATTTLAISRSSTSTSAASARRSKRIHRSQNTSRKSGAMDIVGGVVIDRGIRSWHKAVFELCADQPDHAHHHGRPVHFRHLPVLCVRR